MGVVFALFYLRTRRAAAADHRAHPVDVVAYLGYTLLRDKVPFLR
jgi:hypothetical protein